MSSSGLSESTNLHQLPPAPDYSFWSRNPFWTIEEGVALSLGIDPAHIDRLFAMESAEAKAFVAEYHRRLQIAGRAQTVGDLLSFPPPGFFVGWLQGLKLFVPDALVQHVTAVGYQIADWRGLLELEQQRVLTAMRAAYEAHGTLLKERAEHAAALANLHERFLQDQRSLLDDYKQVVAMFEVTHQEVESLRAAASAQKTDAKPNPKTLTGHRKCLLGLAIRELGYDPTAEKSPIPSEIAELVAECGMEIDEGTVRKYLKDAYDELGSTLQMCDAE